ncbi:MAG: PCMD domain-containing protein, partial [Muribaculaceae bacterium]|nr:PCMD domain-containing protein [Muribaculaceae bacterium]
MKSKLYLILYSFLLILSFGSCSETKSFLESDGEGRLIIIPSITSSTTTVESREISSQEKQALLSTLSLVVNNEKGQPVRYWTPEDKMNWTGEEYNSNIEFTLAPGIYQIEGWAGDSVPASFIKSFYKGVTQPIVVGNNEVEAELTCRITNVAVRVTLNDDLKQLLGNDYSVTVGHMAGSLVYENISGHNTIDSTGYFMMPKGDKNLTYVFRSESKKLEYKDIIEAPQSGKLYNINFSYVSADVDQGGVYISDDLILTSEVQYEKDPDSEFTIRANPVVTCSYSDKNNTEISSSGERYNAEWAEVGDIKLDFKTTGSFSSIVLQCAELFNPIIGSSSIDIYRVFKNPTGTSYWDLINQGVKCEDEGQNLIMTFPASFTNALLNKTYRLNMTLKDNDGHGGDIREIHRTFILRVTGDGVAIDEIDEITEEDILTSVWDTQKVLRVQKLRETVEQVEILYREVGSNTAWESANSISTKEGDYEPGENLSKPVLSNSTGYFYGVTPVINKIDGSLETFDKRYEYSARYFENGNWSYIDEPEEGYPTFRIYLPQLPNNSFEDWNGSKPSLIYPTGGTMFWDSGNHGSKTAGSDVTTSSESYKHTGKYSAQLKSTNFNFVVYQQFAAGNIFIGEYLKTDGTNGVLGWGRKWNQRPKQLKGWLRYEGGKVDKGSGSPLVNLGDDDIGIVYIALLDDSKRQGDTSYPNYPVVVRTKDQHLFNSRSGDVIAYGEYTTTGTEGNGMIEFIINLEYSRNDAVPSYIMVTASASVGGDYF